MEFYCCLLLLWRFTSVLSNNCFKLRKNIKKKFQQKEFEYQVSALCVAAFNFKYDVIFIGDLAFKEFVS